MAKKENLLKFGEKTRLKALDDMRGKQLYQKTFGIRLPVEAAEKLLKLGTKERTLLMRRAVLKELESLN
jgi:hypothetical protein